MNLINTSVRAFNSCLLILVCALLPGNARTQSNTTTGNFAGNSLTLGATDNTLIGNRAGFTITTSDRNTALGSFALGNIDDDQASDLIGIGYNALLGIGSTSTGDQNIAIGGNSLSAFTTANDNIAIGFSTMQAATTATDNIVIGADAGFNMTTASDNIIIGSDAGEGMTTAQKNVFVGDFAGNKTTTGEGNTFVGYLTGFDNLTGTGNTAVGGYYAPSLSEVTTYDLGGGECGRELLGDFNSFFGAGAGNDSDNGFANTFLGTGAGGRNRRADMNTAVGFAAGKYNNVSNGASDANYNTFIGALSAGDNDAGQYNVALGYSSGFGNDGSDNCIAIGANAKTGNSTTDRDYAIVIGNDALGNGSRNVALGGDIVQVVDNSIGIGYQAEVAASNSIAIGYQTAVTAANSVMIGNETTSSIRGNVSWSTTSDGRFKTNVRQNVPGLDFINQLEPVTYNLMPEAIAAHYDRDIAPELLEAAKEKAQITYAGFIAQDVEQAARALNFNFSGIDAPEDDCGSYGLRYAEFVVPLVKAVQEQQEIINDQQALINQLKQENAAYNARLEKIEARLGINLDQIVSITPVKYHQTAKN